MEGNNVELGKPRLEGHADLSEKPQRACHHQLGLQTPLGRVWDTSSLVPLLWAQGLHRTPSKTFLNE